MFEVPAGEEWKHLFSLYDFKKIEIQTDDFEYSVYPEGSIERFGTTYPLVSWKVHLSNRLTQTRWSWGMMMFYFEKGIPDDEWMISPGRKGESIEYFPHFEETDFTEDLKKFDVPTLVMHGDDDQIVPIGASAMLSSKLVPSAQLKVYEGFPHGMCTTHHETVNADLLEFFKS